MTIRPKVLFFDVNETLLDLTSIKPIIANSLNGNQELLTIWFTTMLQYSLVTSASGQYFSFSDIGAATLQMIALNNGIVISELVAKTTITNAMQSLPAHPDVKPALTALKNNNYKLVAFTNSSKKGVKNQLENANLSLYFDDVLSVEGVKKFKPFTDSYTWASKKIGIKPTESMLIAAHGWDVAGALWANWRAAFISRPGQQLYPLAKKPEFVKPDLLALSKTLIKLT